MEPNQEPESNDLPLPPPGTGTRGADPEADAALARAAQRGEKRAFVEIVARHQAMVCGVALGVLGDFTASEDAAQEAFITAWRKIHDLREPEKLRAWLAQIARNTALGHLRRAKAAGRALPGSMPSGETPDGDSPPAPDELAVSGEEAVLVRGALAGLPENYRLPLVLFYRQDQSVSEVAATLSLSEDAVKQRLARGRSLLRERMSGLIETALRHTRPGAVFTMTIAAAIGALTSPAAIAGTAFAAAAATTASVSATAASSVTSTTTATAAPAVTVMTASKLSLTTAALFAAACLPIGYAVRYGTEPPLASPLDASAGAAHASVKKGEPFTPDFKNSPLFAEWVRLHEEHGHGAEAMPALFKAISEVKDTFRRRAFRAALVAEWGQVDPGGGLDFFLKDGADGNARKQLFLQWLNRDPAAAMARLKAAGAPGDYLAQETLSDIAKHAPGEVGAIASRLGPPDGPWSRPVAEAFAILAAKDPESARAAAEAVTGPRLAEALEGVAKAWAKKDMDAVIKWTAGLPEGTDRDAILRSGLTGLAGSNPAAALAKVDLVPPGGRPAFFADTTAARVVKEAGEANFDDTTAWLRDNPDKVSGQDTAGLSNVVGRRLQADPAGFLNRELERGTLGMLGDSLHSALLNDASPALPAVWEWLKAHPNEKAASGLRDAVLNSAGWQNTDLAMQIAKDTPNTPEGKQIMERMAQSLLNGGSRMSQLEGFLKEAPPALKQQLTLSAFNFLRPDTVGDPAVWLPRFDSLPADARTNAAGNLAGAWASRNPADAAEWAAALPVTEGRSEALKGVAASWLKRDSLAASEWVAAMPAGPDRDAGAQSVVREIREESPDDAWQWAVSIQDPAMRLTSAGDALESLAERAPEEAQRWIGESALPDADKAKLRARLEAAAANPKGGK